MGEFLEVEADLYKLCITKVCIIREIDKKMKYI